MSLDDVDRYIMENGYPDEEEPSLDEELCWRIGELRDHVREERELLD